MRLLLVETTEYAPLSPLFLQACAAKQAADPSFQYSFFDEASFSWPWTFAFMLFARITAFEPDVILFVKGNLVTPTMFQGIRDLTSARLVCWQPDNPWNRKACRERILECVPFYDVYLTCKTALLDDLTQAGAQQVTYLPCGYKPQIHFVEDGHLDRYLDPFCCDLAVIGGADEERLMIVKEIRRAYPDLTMNLYGGYWDHDTDLRPFAKGIVSGWEYRAAIRCATVCLNLLRSPNQDQHNMRTFEIPACGGLMLTRETQEHKDIFGESAPLYYGHTATLLEALGEALDIATFARPSIIHGTENAIKNATWNARLEQLCAVLSSSSAKTAASPLTT